MSEAKSLVYLRPRDLEADENPTDWILKPYVAKGVMTELTGEKKTAGKSTFLYKLIDLMTSGGGEMLGFQVPAGKVMYLTEQTPASMREQIWREAGIRSDDMLILPHYSVIGRPWEKVCRQAVADAIRLGVSLIVIDTLPHFALKGDVDEENSAAAAIAAMRPLQEAQAHNIAVVLVRHTRKRKGSVGNAGRGSSAYGGMVDIIMLMDRGGGKRTRRTIDGVGRYSAVPSRLIVERMPDGAWIIADGKVKPPDRTKDILELLPSSLGDLEESINVPRSTLRRQLLELQEKGLVDVTKNGRVQIWSKTDGKANTDDNG